MSELFQSDSICRYLGTPYKRGGSDSSGFDCSGLTRRIYSEIFGLELPHNSYEQSRLGIFESVPLTEDELEPNDLLFFAYKKKHINHVGIYLSDGKFLHASPKGGVKISNLEDPFWKRSLVASRRVKDTLMGKVSGISGKEMPVGIDGSDVVEDHEISLGYAAALDKSFLLSFETFYMGRFTTRNIASLDESLDLPQNGPTQKAAMDLETWHGVRISADIHPAEWLRITPSLGMVDTPSWADDISRNWQVYGLEAAVSPMASRWSLTFSVRSLLNDSYYDVYQDAPDTNMGLHFNYQVSNVMALSLMGNWEGSYLMRDTGSEDTLRDVRDVSLNLNFSF